MPSVEEDANALGNNNGAQDQTPVPDDDALEAAEGKGHQLRSSHYTSWKYSYDIE